MTVLTMTTVGYEEVRPAFTARSLFSTCSSCWAVWGLMFYILTVTVQTVVEDEVLRVFMRRRRMKSSRSMRLKGPFHTLWLSAGWAVKPPPRFHGEDVDVDRR